MATDWVRIRHKTTGGVTQVPERALPGWIDLGWEPVPDEIPEPPPRAGKGSGRDEWAAYAAFLGVAVSDDDSRDDIAAAVDQHLNDLAGDGDNEGVNNDG